MEKEFIRSSVVLGDEPPGPEGEFVKRHLAPLHEVAEKMIRLLNQEGYHIAQILYLLGYAAKRGSCILVEAKGVDEGEAYQRFQEERASVAIDVMERLRAERPGWDNIDLMCVFLEGLLAMHAGAMFAAAHPDVSDLKH